LLYIAILYIKLLKILFIVKLKLKHRVKNKMKSLSLVKDEDINNFYKLVSENVKRIRNEKNKPQLDLVLEMGLKSTAFYSRCENFKDNHHFNMEHIFKIAIILDVDIKDFFQGIEIKDNSKELS
jgi:putative transcriptional regulator